jgi:hypothetical protein
MALERIRAPFPFALAGYVCAVAQLLFSVAFADSSPTEVFAKGAPVRCHFRHEGWITTSTGPCEDFTPPARNSIGAKFKANGKDRTIGAITAIQADSDWTYGDFKKNA